MTNKGDLIMLNVIRALSVVVLVFSFFNLNSFAMDPDEYCRIHEESNGPGECKVHGKCAEFTTVFGNKEYKKCTDGGCTLVENDDECEYTEDIEEPESEE